MNAVRGRDCHPAASGCKMGRVLLSYGIWNVLPFHRVKGIMGLVWDAVDDEIQLFARIFLAIFVLIGLIPFFQKNLSRLQAYILSKRRTRTPGLAASLSASVAGSSRISEIEYLVFRQLSHAGARGMSPRSLARRLHMETLLVRKVLQSLKDRELVCPAPGFAVGNRYSLSRDGRALAVLEGLAPRVSPSTSDQSRDRQRLRHTAR